MSTDLTDDELIAMWNAESVPNRRTSEFVRAFARAAIAADRNRRASSLASTEDLSAERAAFEAARLARFDDPYAKNPLPAEWVARWPDGRYVEPGTENAWRVWKCCVARRASSAAAVPAEPVAHLWQHTETGRTRIVMPDQIITADAHWIVVGPLYLGATLSPPQAVPAQPLRRGVDGICTRKTCECEREDLGDQCVWLRPTDAELERRTGEPHIDGWPLYSGLPPALPGADAADVPEADFGDMPPLPEAALADGKYGYRVSHENYYTADQMREYGQACRAVGAGSREPLTEEQMDEVRIEAGIAGSLMMLDILFRYGRAIERAHGIAARGKA